MKDIERNIPYKPEVLDKLHRLQIEMLKDLDEICTKHHIQYFAVFGTALGATRHNGFIPWDDDIDVGMLREDYERFMKIVDSEMGDKYQMMTAAIDSNYACCVTKFQRKGTKFLSHLAEKLNCEQCIFIDIFPFDSLADDEKLRKQQYYKTLILDRLIYLCGSAHPIIPYKGIKHDIAAAICWCVHYILKIFHVSAGMLFRQFEKECVRYNNSDMKEITTFGDGACLNYRMSVNDILPVHKIDFESIRIPVMKKNHEHLVKTYGNYMEMPPKEKQINHAPYLIDFGNFENEASNVC